MTLTPEAVVGMMVVFGIALVAILVLLKKLGVISFTNSSQCPEHRSFCDAFKTLKDEHIIQGEHIKQHEKQLEESKAAFVIIKSDIAEIKADIKLIMYKLKIVKPEG